MTAAFCAFPYMMAFLLNCSEYTLKGRKSRVNMVCGDV